VKDRIAQRLLREARERALDGYLATLTQNAHVLRHDDELGEVSVKSTTPDDIALHQTEN